MYRDREPTLTGELSPDLLQRAISSLPENIYAPRNTLPDRARPPPENSLADIDSADVKDGAYAIRDGLLAIRRGPVFETAKVPGSVACRIRGMLAVRDAIRVVFRTQLDDAPGGAHRRSAETSQRHLRFLYLPLRRAVVAREHQGLCRRSRPASLTLLRELTIPRPSAPPSRRYSNGGHWSAINRSPMSRRPPKRSPSR